MCANEDVCEEDKATQHRGFLGGSKISYSTPHRREAHTHTNQIRLHMVVRHNTKPSTHTHGWSVQHQALHTHRVVGHNTKPSTHTHTHKYVQTTTRNNLLSSTWTNLEKSRLSRKWKDAQTSYKTFLLSNLPKTEYQKIFFWTLENSVAPSWLTLSLSLF